MKTSRKPKTASQDVDGFGFLRAQLEGELLRWAVGRAITCPYCGAILDCRRAVLADSPSQGSTVACVACWDKAKDHVLATIPDLEVTDGRDIPR